MLRREDHPVTLPLGPPVRSDYERALERIRELERRVASREAEGDLLAAQLYDSEEERLRAKTEAGNLQLRLDESLAREGALNTRLSNLDTLAREVSARVEKMLGSVDNAKPIA